MPPSEMASPGSASPVARPPSPSSPKASAPRPLDERSPNPVAPPRSPRGGRDRRDGGGRGDRGDRVDRRRDGGRHGGGRGGDSYRPAKKARTPPPVPTEEQKQAAAKAEYEKLLNARSGGTYVPPARLRALQAQITDKTSMAYQRMAWDALKKSINGLINKVNVSNIKPLVPELFNENLIRGRGLFCQSAIKAQAASLPFTPIYAALMAVVNTKLPQVGELLLKRLVLRFRKAFRRNDKAVCLSATTFVAHLVNQQVAHEMVAAQMLLLLLNKPTDDSVEIAVGLTREVGQFLEEMNAAIANVVFDRFRDILHEADITKRTQYMIEVLFQTRKDRFKDNPAIKEELDLVEESDQIKHFVELTDTELDGQDMLNIFKFDPDYEENEEKYKKLKAEILGEGSDYENDDGSGDDDDDESSESEAEEAKAVDIKDRSNADLVALRRTIYLTLMSSMDPEEAVHKLMKLNLPVGQEGELPSLVVESCAQERTYSKFYGAIGERLAKINRLWTDLFERSFEHYYGTIHRYETNRLRNIARFFGHVFASDAIGWHALSVIHLNEEETTSASRIFIKILFNEMLEEMGMPKLQARMRDEVLRPSLEGLFPRDTARNVRFSINYFTSIGMGALTEESREFLEKMPKPMLPALMPARAGDDSDSESVGSYSSYTGSSYSSRSRSRSRSISRSRSPPPRRAVAAAGAIDRRRDSFSRSRSRSRSRTRSLSRSLSRSQSRSRSPSRSRRTPPRRRSYRSRDRSFSASRSPSRSQSRSRTPPRRTVGGQKQQQHQQQQQRKRPRSYTPSDRGGGRDRTRSLTRSRSRSRSRSYDSRSRSPPPAAVAGRGRAPSRTPEPVPSPLPAARGSAGAGRTAMPHRGGRLPPAAASGPATAAVRPTPALRRSYSADSRSRSPSRSRSRTATGARTRSPLPQRRRAGRRDSSHSRSRSRSRTPSRGRGRGRGRSQTRTPTPSAPAVAATTTSRDRSPPSRSPSRSRTRSRGTDSVRAAPLARGGGDPSGGKGGGGRSHHTRSPSRSPSPAPSAGRRRRRGSSSSGSGSAPRKRRRAS